MSGAKVAVIEDDADILELIVYNLQRDGYRTATARSGIDAWELINRERPDIVLLDLMLPGLDGIEICRRLKSSPDTEPISVIIVSAKDDESDVVLGLGVGADDYVTKPFRPKELLARVRTVLRRGQHRDGNGEKGVIVRGPLTIDADRHIVLLEQERLDITATEFRLLHFLAQHPGRAYTREQLIKRSIGEGAMVTARNIDVHVRSIRQKLAQHRYLIETIRGVGYRFCDTEEA